MNLNSGQQFQFPDTKGAQQQQNKEESKLFGTITKSKVRFQSQVNKTNEEKVNELNKEIEKVDSNIQLSGRFKSHIIVGYEQQKLELLLESNQAKKVTSIPHISQQINSNNLELLFYVLSENIRKDQSRTLLITPKSSRIGFASVLYPEAADHYCWKLHIKDGNYEEIMNDEKYQAKFILQFKEKVSKCLSVSTTDVQILDIEKGSIIVFFTVFSKDRMNQNELQALEQICGGSIEVFNYFAGNRNNQYVGLSSQDFTPQYNMTWSTTHIEKQQRGPCYHKYDYYFPRGYTGYALNVLNKYDIDNKWLLMDGNDKEWRILYHGTKHEYLQQIVQQGILPGQRQAYMPQMCVLTNQIVGRGVYFSDKISVSERFAQPTKIGNKTFTLIFQSRVNPRALKQSQQMKQFDFFVVNNTKDIRPYRILLKEI